MTALRKAHPEWIFIDEPVDTWTSLSNNQGESLLQVFYNDKNRWSYTFQNCALLSRYDNIEGCIKKASNSRKGVVVYVTERCLDTDREVFAKMLKDEACLDNLEYDLYEKWFSFVKNNSTPLSAIIYVDTPPNVCSERIAKRNRNGESNIPLSYLQKLEKFQSSWIDSTNVPIVRATKLNQASEFVTNLISDIKKKSKFVNEHSYPKLNGESLIEN